MTFEPARFLQSDVHRPEPDPRDHVFGYGRRACPGQQLAEHSMWLTCATSLATLAVTKKVDQDGASIVPGIEYIGQGIT
jgi:cytochrome P450